MNRLYALALLLVIPSFLCAQQFGGFPPSTHWRQINTDTARIIFTPGAEWQAQRIATLIHKAAADTPFALGNQLHKINIVLQSRTTLANGYVGLAPFRSEYYLVPSSNVYDFGNLPWHENLALHEYRHVQQYNNFRHGLSKGFYYLFGEQGLAFANAITIPDWFFEGDAVHSETALSEQGRGRLSYFLSGYNSLWLEHRNYSWLKLRNGSLKDYVPNHYPLGYLLVNYGYLKYGEGFWKEVTQDAADFKGLLYPFQKAVKKYAGVDYRTFRKQAFDYYRQQLGDIATTPKPENRVRTKTVTNYFFPQYVDADSLVYLQSAYNKIPAFYVRDREGTHRLAQRSISSEDWFSYRDGQIAYTAYSTHPRWGLIDYSDIRVLDENTHHERRLTHKARYYTPDFSPSGDKLIAVRITDSLESRLEVLDSHNGAVLQTFRSEGGQYYTNPRFVSDHHIVAGVRTTDSRMSLQLLDLSTGAWSRLVPYSFHSISQPYVHNDTIYFTANFMGNDDVYALKLSDGKIYQLTRRSTGTYFPSVHNDSLVFSSFTSRGLALESEPLNKALWAELSPEALKGYKPMYPVAVQKTLLPTRTERYSIKRYEKGTGLFNFHSWAPNYNDPEFTFSLYGDNILSTFSNEIYYRYNQNENSHGIGWNSSYAGLFPYINAGVEYTFHRTIRTTTRTIYFEELEPRIGYSIPLNFSQGKTYKFLNFGSNFVYNHQAATGLYKDSIKAANAYYLHHFISWAQYLPMALQHIYPKFGYTLSAAHRHLLDRNGFQFVGNAQLFLPSFGNHSIVLAGTFQETDTNNTVFSNRFANSRGYTDFYFSRMWKLGANYHFPIAYPDLGLGSIVYLQRLRGNAFYDYTRVYSRNKTQSRNLRSVGGELYFDTKWWNQLPVSFGMRVSHLLDNGFAAGDRKGTNYFEFIVPINLIPN